MKIKKSDVPADVVTKRLYTLRGMLLAGPQLKRVKKLGKLKDQ